MRHDHLSITYVDIADELITDIICVVKAVLLKEVRKEMRKRIIR